MIVLGLTGAASSGKSEVAKYLAGHYGFVRFSLLDGTLAEADEWLKNFRACFRYPEQRPQMLVCDDVRFDYEREWVIHNFDDANIWHVHRQGHESETPLPVLDGEREIFNNYNLEYLYKGVEQLLTTSAAFVRLEPPAPLSDHPSLD